MKFKKILVSIFPILFIFCIASKPQAVVWNDSCWGEKIRSWQNRDWNGYIKAYMRCVAKGRYLHRAIIIVQKHILGGGSFRNAKEALEELWGLDKEIRVCNDISNNLDELYKNLKNVESVYRDLSWEYFSEAF